MAMRPVFIVGTARSGTSLLYRTIVLHSDFFVGEVCLEESRVFQESTRILPRLRGKEGNPLYRYMLGDDQRFDEFLKAVYPIALAQRLPDGVLQKCGWRSYSLTLWTALGGKKVVREFFEHAKPARGGKRIVEKTPSHLHSVEHMLYAFPDCRVVSTVRHPIEVYASYIKRYETSGGGWLDVNVDDFIRIYKRDINKIIKLESQLNKFKAIKYENFTRYPKEEFEKICDFIDVKFEVDPVRGRVESLSGWEKDPHLSEPIKEKTKDWEKYVTKEEKEEIYKNINKSMGYFGYNKK